MVSENNHPNTLFVLTSPVIVSGTANAQARPNRIDTANIRKDTSLALLLFDLLRLSYKVDIRNLIRTVSYFDALSMNNDARILSSYKSNFYVELTTAAVI